MSQWSNIWFELRPSTAWPSRAMTLTRMPLHSVNVTVVQYMNISWGPALAFTCNDSHQNAITLCECHSGPIYGLSWGPALAFTCMTLTRMPLHCVNVTVVRYMHCMAFTCNDSHQKAITLCECHSGPMYGLSCGPALAFTCNDSHQKAITLCECHSGPIYVVRYMSILRFELGPSTAWPSRAMTLTRMPLHCVNVTVVRYMV
ncbi:hypothetical protein EMCRGX_G000495 [Ephydatia muelleri]